MPPLFSFTFKYLACYKEKLLHQFFERITTIWHCNNLKVNFKAILIYKILKEKSNISFRVSEITG